MATLLFNAGAVRLYVNGVEVHSGTSSYTSLFSTGTALPRIGRAIESGGFEGLIDEPMMFSRALSGSEIQSIYQAGASGLCGLGQVVVVEEPERPPPGSLSFETPRPNPAGHSTHLTFRLPAAGPVRVEMLDVAGRGVATLIGGRELDAGEHQVSWDGRGASGGRVPPGIYQIRVIAGGAVAVRKVVMIR